MTGFEFAQAARAVIATATSHGLPAPRFRAGTGSSHNRTLRHYPDGPVVAVNVRDRADATVVADMVAGVFAAANRDADEVVADELTAAAHDVLDHPATIRTARRVGPKLRLIRDTQNRGSRPPLVASGREPEQEVAL